MRYEPVCALLSVIILCSACGVFHTVKARRDEAASIAGQAGLVPREVDTGEFSIKTWYREGAGRRDHLQVYIEGDGLAWRRKNRLSDDPTPVDPLALRLAARAGQVSVLYLARPCQYTGDVQAGRCPPRLWSSHRYSEPVVKAMNQVIDFYLQKTGSRSITLVGYSGGGVIASLLAARRTDVKRLVTVAANLDHGLWTDIHGVSPLSGSLNPVDFVDRLRRIPQLHLVGADDEVVPEAVVRSYLEKLGDNPHANLHVLSGYDHECCWADDWPGLMQQSYGKPNRF